MRDFMPRVWPLATGLMLIVLSACTTERVVGTLSASALSGFEYRIPMVVENDPGDVSSTVPIPVTFPATAFEGIDPPPSVKQIALIHADTNEPIPFDVDHWDPAATSVLWVSGIDTLKTDSTVAYLYVGAEDNDDPPRSGDSVFGAEYLAVHHLEGEPFADASPANSTLSDSGSAQASGVIGNGRRFEPGGASMLLTTAAFPMDLSPITACMWVRPSRSDPGFQSFFGYGSPPRVLQEHGLELWLRSEDDVTLAEAVFAVNEWHHICAAVQTDEVNLYVNGAFAADNSGPGYSAENGPARLGAVPDFMSPFEGDMDELRITNRFEDATTISQRHRAMTETWLVTGERVPNSP